MTIIVLVLMLFILITSRITKYNPEYLSKKNTNIIKGIFLILVFFSHFISYKAAFENSWIDQMGIQWIKNIGQLMVTLFLFYSGYGIMESYKTKGENYVKNMPKKRILKTLLNFSAVVLIYMFASKHFINNPFSVKKLVLALIGWDGFGNSNWYIFCILILYCISYLSLKAFKSRKGIVASIFVGTLLYTIIMGIYKQPYWYNTAFCFMLGTIYSLFKDEIERWLKGKELLSFIYLLVTFIILDNFKNNIVWYYFYTLAFTLLIVLVTRKIKIKNIVLEWLGKNLFPLYIFQRLPMLLLYKKPFMHNNPYAFLAVSFVVTILITLAYNFVFFACRKTKEKIFVNKTDKKEMN